MWAELDALMEAEGICEADVWDADAGELAEPYLCGRPKRTSVG